MKRLSLSVICFLLSFCAGLADTHKPWTFWYWMYGAVSEEGVRADLQAMKDVGLGGCYLMPIRGAAERQEYKGTADALSENFWRMVDLSLMQADSLGLGMGIHICDGFALAGGPWIAPEESMQKIVFSDTIVVGRISQLIKRKGGLTLQRPKGYDGYYEDIAAFAIPLTRRSFTPLPYSFDIQRDLGETNGQGSMVNVQCSPTMTRNAKGVFTASEPAWIQFDMGKPRLFSNIEIAANGTNMQAQRMMVEASDDGVSFRCVKQLVPPRQGWQNYDHNTTFAIPPTEARYWRLSWTPEGTEPGSEDMDAAKWRPRLGLKNAVFHTQPCIDNWEGKAGYVWRIAPDSNPGELPDSICWQQREIARLTLEGDRVTDYKLESTDTPYYVYRIVRIGHTATGHTNATAGGAKGLECDKFSPKAVSKQADSWFGLFKKRPHADVVKYLHVDSWECGSQNWSRTFAQEFKARRGYDLLPWLPVMIGIPVESATKSDQVLRDVRLTINDLINEVFFATVRQKAGEYGVQFSCESVAPTMVSDGMQHYKYADIPMGEFWLNSPTHDKPNDMLDAISGAHVYGKNIVQAEGFTEVRGVWDETPAMVKPLLERNFCLGMNRLFFHVNAHNPWLDKKPGMTLDGIGLFFQRDQTWFPEAKGLVDYITRCQNFLQRGKPVVDIAVYTGEEMPRRAFTPDRLVPMLPGIFGTERVAEERARLANIGQPMEESPVGVKHSANILDLKDWINPLHGYQYDSMNKDGLSRWLAKLFDPATNDMPNYRVLVVPQNVKVSHETQARIDSLKLYGITVITEPYKEQTLPGLSPDVILPEGIAYTHRKQNKRHCYFLSNQTDSVRTFQAKFRIDDRVTELINPLTGTPMAFHEQRDGEYSCVNITLPRYGSVFVMSGSHTLDVWPESQYMQYTKPLGENLKWDVTFRENGEQVNTHQLFDWSQSDNECIRYFSGHARYKTTFTMKKRELKHSTWWLRLPEVRDVAHVWLNGIDLGIVWTEPYQVKLGKHLRKGKNTLEIEVVNTWHNALRGADKGMPPYEGIWTNAKYRTEGDALMPAGLLKTPLLLKQEHSGIRAAFERFR